MLQHLTMIRGMALGAVLAWAGTAVGAGAADISPADRLFVEEAARAGMAEVVLGRLAMEKSSDDRVREFGERMVQDHEQANAALKAVSRELVLPVPSNKEASQLPTLVKLQGLSGTSFDREYMQQVVASLKKAIVLYDQQATAGDSAELRAFSAKTLPLLQRQLLLAESIEKAVVAGAKVAARKSGKASPSVAGALGEMS